MKHYKNISGALLLCCFMIASSACSEDNFGPDPSKDWNGTTAFFNSVDESGFQTYYNPAIGRCGDPMPFYDAKEGHFKVLYLQEFDNNAAFNYHPIWGVSTADGANYQSLGEILPFGDNDYQQDAALGTGCCYYNEQAATYYIYYTGHNGNCKNREVVMRATSKDFKSWTKDELWTLKGPDYGYSGNDFRDPQVFVADDGLYHMVISTYPASGGDPVFAEFKSSDMQTWEHVGHFKMIWDRMLECPDIFKMGDWWYLVYSESVKTSWSRKVKYMMAPTYEALKTCFNDPGANWPKDGHEGVLDSRAFYAGKTASNGTDRLIWGWCPFRSGSDIAYPEVSEAFGINRCPKQFRIFIIFDRYLCFYLTFFDEFPAVTQIYHILFFLKYAGHIYISKVIKYKRICITETGNLYRYITHPQNIIY